MSWYFFPPPPGEDASKECQLEKKCDLFSDALRHNEYVKGIDVYLVDESAPGPCFIPPRSWIRRSSLA